LKVKICEEKQVKEVDTSFGTIKENSDGTFLSIIAEHFSVYLCKNDSKKVYEIQIKYKIYRPCHDHDNFPEITLEIPYGGVLECECGEHEEKSAKLVIMDDSGHLMLDTFFKHFVWEPEVPVDLWEALEKHKKKK